MAVQGADEIVFSMVFLQHFPGAVGGVVVDGDNLHQRPVVVAFQQGIQGVAQHQLLVVHGNQHGDGFHLAGDDVPIVELLAAQKPLHRKIEVTQGIQQHQPDDKEHIPLQQPYDHSHSSFPLADS